MFNTLEKSSSVLWSTEPSRRIVVEPTASAEKIHSRQGEVELAMTAQRNWIVLCVVALTLLLAGCGGGLTTEVPEAAKEHVWTRPALATDAAGNQAELPYTSVDSGAGSEVRICVLFPHLKDPYWVGLAYGTWVEAQRTGASYDLYAADGYGDLPRQIDQAKDCINSGRYDALVIGAISGDGTCDTIRQALQKKMVVIDSVNGMACGEEVTSDPRYARTLVSYYVLGQTAARYIAGLDQELDLLALTGPQGVPWSDSLLAGLKNGLEGSKAKVVAAPRGDMDATVQLALAGDALSADRSIDAVFGTSVTMSAGISAVHNSGRKDIRLFNGALDGDSYKGIADGQIAVGASDLGPIIARMAIDTAVRLVTQPGGVAYRTIGPKPILVDSDTIHNVAREDILSPPGFKPVLNFDSKKK
ncbi:substrate-binding domain-containing protein [Nocardia sp. NPDC047038]|uniref:substrate-binding domain-containing protein n=1 Tax=Nocardia sp. NPDC047038 TaxID=3154338 RepID=UPI0033F2EF27